MSLRLLATAVLVDGADRGLWPIPPCCSTIPPVPTGVTQWFTRPFEGRTMRLVRFGPDGTHGFVVLVGDPGMCRELLLVGVNQIGDPACRPVIGMGGGRYTDFAPVGVGGDA